MNTNKLRTYLVHVFGLQGQTNTTHSRLKKLLERYGLNKTEPTGPCRRHYRSHLRRDLRSRSEIPSNHPKNANATTPSPTLL